MAATKIKSMFNDLLHELDTVLHLYLCGFVIFYNFRNFLFVIFKKYFKYIDKSYKFI